MSENVCPYCREPMTGVAMVDGYRNGKRFGESRPYCQSAACDRRRYPFRGVGGGPRLRQARLEIPMSLNEASELTGVPANVLSGVEMGRALPPPPHVIDSWIHSMRSARPAEGRQTA